MSRRPFDPSELNGDGDELRPVAGRLEEYVRSTASVDAPGRLGERVMSSLPERGGGGVMGGLFKRLRAAPLALLLLLLVGFGGVLAVGQVTGAFSILPVESAAPTLEPTIEPPFTESASPLASPEPSPAESAVPSPSDSGLPTVGPTDSASPEPSESPTEPPG